MARMVVVYGTPENPAEFDKLRFDGHLPLAETLPGLRKYEVSRGPIRAPAGDGAPYLIGTLYFDDMAAIDKAFASEAGRACAADRRVLAPEGADIRMYLFDEYEV